MNATGAAQESALPDRARFVGHPAAADVRIAPDARSIAFLAPHDGVMQLWLVGRDTPLDSAVRLSDGPVESYRWSRDSQYLLFFRDRDGDEHYHLHAVEADTTGAGSPRDLTPYGEAVQARLYALPDTTPEFAVVGINDRDPSVHDVHRIRITTGERELLLQNDHGFVDWVIDVTGVPRVGVRHGPEGSGELIRVDGDTLTPVFGCGPDEQCVPLQYHWDNRRIYMVTNQGDRDLTELVLFHPRTREEQLVDRDPDGRVDFGEAVFAPGSRELLATAYFDDTTRYYPHDSLFERDLPRLGEHLPLGRLRFGAATAEDAIWTVTVDNDSTGGLTYLFDRWNNTVDLVAQHRPARDRVATSRWIRYPVRDGSTVPALLTVPAGDPASPAPAVVMPHDDPWQLQRVRSDPLVQFLASRGYAVLQPTTRGSVGYGETFLAAGNGGWGTGVMQHDLTDAASYLADQGIADPDRIGIVGMGYGGYAALAALAFTPDRFAAGVAVGGISDLIGFASSGPAHAARARATRTHRIGDPDEPEQRVRLGAQSPAGAWDQITAPVLLAHGTSDPHVAVDQTERVVAALRRSGRVVEYLRLQGEGRRLRHAENRVAFAAVLERFLGQHLGGRAQDSTAPAVATRIAQLTIDPSEPLGAVAVAVTAPLPPVDGAAVRRAELRYRITIAGDTTQAEFTRRVIRTSADGRDIWRIVDSAMVPIYPMLEFDTAGIQVPQDGGPLPDLPAELPELLPTGDSAAAEDTVDLDRRTLLPLRRRVGGPVNFSLRFTPDSVIGEYEVGEFFDDVEVALSAPVFSDASGLELAIATLPLVGGYETVLRVFDATLQRVVALTLAVTAAERVRVPAGEFDVFRVALIPVNDPEAETRMLLLRRDMPHILIRGDMQTGSAQDGFRQTMELIEIERL